MAALKTPLESSLLDAATAAATSPRRAPVPGYWIRIAMVVVAISLGTAALRLGTVGGTLLDSLVHALVYSGCIATLAGAIVPPIRHRTRAMGTLVEWTATLAGLAVVAVGGTFVACIALGLFGYGSGQPLTRRFAASFEMNALITAVIGIAMTLYESQRARLDALTLELRTRELERERDRKAALQARLASLESRLHPHFLFNTLNAISALVHDDPDAAERTVERLATLLRAALDATGQTTVPLGQELAIVRDYLEIEKTRFGDRLTYAIDVPDAARACELPPLAVQTLVENSVKHAIAPRPAGGRVRVEACVDGDRLTVSAWDDGEGFTLSAAAPGHGLENLQSRLGALFGDAATLDVRRHDGGTLVTISLPRKTAGP
jgi:two-component system, LytTR family, sensor histidine kinase AlgZ